MPDQIYLEFGADPRIEGLDHEEERKEIRRRAIQAGLKLVDCSIRHMGTEKAQEHLSGHRAVLTGKRGGDVLRLRVPQPDPGRTRSARAFPSPTARRTWRSTPSIPW